MHRLFAAFGFHPSLPPPVPAGGQELRMDVVETTSGGQPRHDASGGPHCDQVGGSSSGVREDTSVLRRSSSVPHGRTTPVLRPEQHWCAVCTHGASRRAF